MPYKVFPFVLYTLFTFYKINYIGYIVYIFTRTQHALGGGGGIIKFFFVKKLGNKFSGNINQVGRNHTYKKNNKVLLVCLRASLNT